MKHHQEMIPHPKSIVPLDWPALSQSAQQEILPQMEIVCAYELVPAQCYSVEVLYK